MWLLILADASTAAQQSSFLTVLFSGIAAVGGVAGACGGIFSAVYTTNAGREKAERELLASKLETLYSELKDEVMETTKAVEIVDTEVKRGIPPARIFAENEEMFRPIWTEINTGEILISFYFGELAPSFDTFRENRTRIGLLLRGLSRAPFGNAAMLPIHKHANQMIDAYSQLRIEMSEIAKRICPRK
jgi:hypothetical protein